MAVNVSHQDNLAAYTLASAVPVSSVALQLLLHDKEKRAGFLRGVQYYFSKMFGPEYHAYLTNEELNRYRQFRALGYSPLFSYDKAIESTGLLSGATPEKIAESKKFILPGDREKFLSLAKGENNKTHRRSPFVPLPFGPLGFNRAFPMFPLAGPFGPMPSMPFPMGAPMPSMPFPMGAPMPSMPFPMSGPFIGP